MQMKQIAQRTLSPQHAPSVIVALFGTRLGRHKPGVWHCDTPIGCFCGRASHFYLTKKS
jgi:hypothetical protein